MGWSSTSCLHLALFVSPLSFAFFQSAFLAFSFLFSFLFFLSFFLSFFLFEKTEFILVYRFFELDILFVYILNVIPFPGFPSANPLSKHPLSCFYEGAPPPIHLPLCHHPSIPLHWGIKPSKDQGPPLQLMPDKSPSAPSILPLTPPLGALCLVWW